MVSKQQDVRSQDKQQPGKDAWTTPRLVTLDAADAEGGANPINPEGAFAIGS